MTQHIALFCSCVNDYFALDIFTINCNLYPCSYLLDIVYFWSVIALISWPKQKPHCHETTLYRFPSLFN